MSAGLREKYGKWLIIGPAMVVVLVIVSGVYLSVAFPRVRCEGGKHLDGGPEDRIG